jgi:hypothetical protein
LRSGTIVFHGFRYWWQGFEPDGTALRDAMAIYPDADPSRVFRVEDCSEIILESSGSPPRYSLRIMRGDAGKRRLLRSRSFWHCLIDFARENQPRYREYSYALHGDVYTVPVNAEQVARLARMGSQFAARTLRSDLAGTFGGGVVISQAVFVCPRGK